MCSPQVYSLATLSPEVPQPGRSWNAIRYTREEYVPLRAHMSDQVKGNRNGKQKMTARMDLPGEATHEISRFVDACSGTVD